jgi:hypothetical protein
MFENFKHVGNKAAHYDASAARCEPSSNTIVKFANVTRINIFEIGDSDSQVTCRDTDTGIEQLIGLFVPPALSLLRTSVRGRNTLRRYCPCHS